MSEDFERKRAARSAWYGRICILVLFFVAASASFNGFYQKWHFREAGTSAYMAGASLDAMLDGSALRPYVYRQLLPMASNWIGARISEPTKDQLFNVRLYSGKLFRDDFIDSPLAQNRAYFLRYWIVHTLVFLFAWLAVHVMYLTARAAGNPPLPSAVASVAMILVMPYFFTRGGFFYDYPELAFLVLAIWIALRFDWFWLIPVAVLGAWNKESFVLFIPALYPLLRRRSSRAGSLVACAALGLTCACVYAALRFRFRLNPGGAFEWHLPDQIDYMMHPANLLLREKTYGVLMFQAFNPLVGALIIWTAARGWRLLPRPLQRHAQIAALINFPMYLLFCLPGEIRDLSLLYPTLLFLIAANLTLANDPGIGAAGRLLTHETSAQTVPSVVVD